MWGKEEEAIFYFPRISFSIFSELLFFCAAQHRRAVIKVESRRKNNFHFSYQCCHLWKENLICKDLQGFAYDFIHCFTSFNDEYFHYMRVGSFYDSTECHFSLSLPYDTRMAGDKKWKLFFLYARKSSSQLSSMSFSFSPLNGVG